MPSTTTLTLAPAPPMRDLPKDQQDRRTAFVGRIFSAGLQLLELGTMHLGMRLGYYAALEKHGPLTAKQLAKHTDTDVRYAREWLEQQAVAGILEVAKPGDADRRTFSIPPAHAEVLLDEQSLFFLGFMPMFGAAVPSVLPKVEKAFRTGGGVSWGEYGALTWQGQAAQNRPFLTHQFAQDYLAKIPGVAKALKKRGARVADIACGGGWAALGLARVHPGLLVDGFDLDKDAVAFAKKQAKLERLHDRVKFYARDAAEPGTGHKYDLVTIVEALHDMSQPVAVLKAARAMLAPGGSVVVVDERVLDEFTAPGPDPERFFYSASVTMCLPNGMADKPSAGTGTVMRPSTLKRYAKEAGFKQAEALPLQHDFFRFYQLSG